MTGKQLETKARELLAVEYALDGIDLDLKAEMMLQGPAPAIRAIVAALSPPAPNHGQIKRIATEEARQVAVEYRLNPQQYERHGGKHPIQEVIKRGIIRAIDRAALTPDTPHV